MNPNAVEEKLGEVGALLEERFSTRMLDERSIAFDYAAGPIPLACYCEVNPDMGGFIFRGIFSPPFPPAQRAVAAEYIHRVNYNLPMGSWAINLDTGDVRWKLEVYQHVFGLVTIITGADIQEAVSAIGENHGVGVIGG